MTDTAVGESEANYTLATYDGADTIHVVDVGRESILAMGSRGRSDYKALCGYVATDWDTSPDADDVSTDDVCQNCAEKAIGLRNAKRLLQGHDA